MQQQQFQPQSQSQPQINQQGEQKFKSSYLPSNLYNLINSDHAKRALLAAIVAAVILSI
jgi:hypothetical protein